jgi:hypothetical protein
VIAGTKSGPEGETLTGRVKISCDAQGVVLQPIEPGLVPSFEFSRGFGYSFKSLVQRPDVDEPSAAKGVQVLVHAVSPPEALLDLGGVPTTGDAVLVRVTVRNFTDRAVAIDPADVELVTGDGDGRSPLSGAALDAAIAPGAAGDRIRGQRFRPLRVAPGTTAAGFLVYPAGRYREARLSTTDVETDETEGFVVPLE